MDEILSVSSEVAEKINKCFDTEKIIEKLDERFENISVNSNNNLNLCYKSFLEVSNQKDDLLKNYRLTINALKELTNKEKEFLIDYLYHNKTFKFMIEKYGLSRRTFFRRALSISKKFNSIYKRLELNEEHITN